MSARIFLIYSLVFCATQSPAAQTPLKAKSASSASTKRRVDTGHNVGRSNQFLKNALIQGTWSDFSDNNAIFIIEKRRVIFFDHIGDVDNEKEYLTYWKLSGNKLSFCYTGGLVVTDAIVKLTKDSLVLYRKDAGFSRYVRLK